MDFPDASTEGLISGNVADPPACHAVSLGESESRDRAVPHIIETRNAHMFATVVENLVVDLVGDGERVMVDAEVPNNSELMTGEDSASGIVWCVDDDCFRLFSEGLFDGFLFNPEFWGLQFHVSASCAGEDCVGTIVLIEWFEDNDL